MAYSKATGASTRGRLEQGGLDTSRGRAYFVAPVQTLQLLLRRPEFCELQRPGTANNEPILAARWGACIYDRRDPVGCLDAFLKLGEGDVSDNAVKSFITDWGVLAVDVWAGDPDGDGFPTHCESLESYRLFARQARSQLLIAADLLAGIQTRAEDWRAAIRQPAQHPIPVANPGAPWAHPLRLSRQGDLKWEWDDAFNEYSYRYNVAALASSWFRNARIVPFFQWLPWQSEPVLTLGLPERWDQNDGLASPANPTLGETSPVRMQDALTSFLAFNNAMEPEYWQHTSGHDQPSRTFCAIAVQLAAALTSPTLARCGICGGPVTHYDKRLPANKVALCEKTDCKQKQHNKVQSRPERRRRNEANQ